MIRLSLPNDFLGTNSTPAPLAKPEEQSLRLSLTCRRSHRSEPCSPLPGHNLCEEANTPPTL